MNWRKRAKVCRLQVYANQRFGSHPIGGVQVITETGDIDYLNSHPKTNWDKELAIAEANIQEEVIAQNKANDLRKKRNGVR